MYCNVGRCREAIGSGVGYISESGEHLAITERIPYHNVNKDEVTRELFLG